MSPIEGWARVRVRQEAFVSLRTAHYSENTAVGWQYCSTMQWRHSTVVLPPASTKLEPLDWKKADPLDNCWRAIVVIGSECCENLEKVAICCWSELIIVFSFRVPTYGEASWPVAGWHKLWFS